VRILVTGVAGFIGSTTAELLVARGDDVIGLDNLSTGDISNVPRGVTLVKADIGDAVTIRTLGPFDACIHFAGLIASGESMEVPELYFENNVGQTMTLLNTLLSSGLNHFVFSSSAAVYGDVTSSPILEASPMSPTSPYGASKAMVEDYVAWLVRQGKFRAANLRYFNAAGATRAHPERHAVETHLIPLALDAAAAGTPMSLFGTDYPTPDGTCIRDYVHVLDLARAHVAAVDTLANRESLTVNLGTGVGYSNREVLRAVESVTGHDLEVRELGRRPGDPATLVASVAAAKEILGWTPQHSSLEEIVRSAWESRQ
jgi:UDP-glucose 4-epimerase